MTIGMFIGSNSILETVKTALGVELDYSGFDNDIILGINTALMTLNQLGIGPENGFKIIGSEEEWDDFLISDVNVEAARSYIVLKTRLLFDPPSSSFVLESINQQIKELEWRLVVQIESPVIS